jgi:hypothetical protein
MDIDVTDKVGKVVEGFNLRAWLEVETHAALGPHNSGERL